MEKSNPEFGKLLHRHVDADVLSDAGSIFGTWADFRLAYLNQAWFGFAESNHGEPQISEEWGLGRTMLDCLPGELAEVFRARCTSCLDSLEVWSYDYECSSSSVYRRFRQIVYPLSQEGFLFVNSLALERPHDSERQAPGIVDPSLYLDENGFFCQCAYCRRTKNYSETNRWDWVPEWVKQMPKNTSSTFCPACYVHYYGKFLE